MFSKKGRRKISSVLAFVLLFSMLVPAMAFGAEVVQLKDIADSYAQKEIQGLVDGGIISGYEDGSFQPRKAMSRAELAKIIVLSLGLKENASKASAFTDVDKNAWYTGFVGALVESKITQGTSDTTFAPDAKVTREELVVFFVRAMGLEEAAGKLAVDAKLSDLKQVSSWAQAHVSLAFKVGFVNGIDDSDGSLKFSPKDNAERQALARLAFEFKNNKSKFVDAAKVLASATGELAVTSVSAVSNTSVEVTFNKDITSVNTADFTFDNGLAVSKAELKAGSTTVVVLTTSAQTLDTVYKLSYKGKDTGLTVKGILVAIIGGGGGGGSSRTTSRLSDLQKINQGGLIQGDLTITSSGTVGPADGNTAVITGTLTLDPGAAGEITLQNVDAATIVVASGSSNSIKLRNAIIKQLKVAANNQTSPVRIESLSGAKVETTEVSSQVIIESTEGSLGTINIGSGAAGKAIELRGRITGSVNVSGAGVTITLAKTQDGKSTSIDTLNVGANATITTAEGTTLGAVTLTAPNTTIALGGTGAILSVTVSKDAKGSTLDIGKGAAITGIKLDGDAQLKGDPATVGGISIVVGNGVTLTPSDDLKTGVKDEANKAIRAIGTITTYSAEKEALILKAENLAKNAILFGVPVSQITDYSLIAVTKRVISEYAMEATYKDLKISYAAGDSANAVSKNISLPTFDPKTGVAISWTSSNPTVVSDTGSVTRPAKGQPDATVVLTVKLAKYGNTWNDIKMTIVVLAEGSVEPSVTSVTYVTYAQTVTGLVYGNQSGTENSPQSPLYIPAANEAGYLIVSFNESLKTDITGVTITSKLSASAATYSVNGATYNYLAIQYPGGRVKGDTYGVTISGLKRASDGATMPTVTIYVYQR